MRTPRIAGAVLVAAVLLLLFVRSGSFFRTGESLQPSSRTTGSLSAADVLPHLQFLADDLLEGRAPSTRGGEVAARYLAAQLSLAGYTPAGDNGTYFQPVPVLESVIEPSTRIAVGGRSLKLSSELVAFSDRIEPTVAVSGDVVFVGHGIVAPEYRWDDYAGLDMNGKVAMVMVNEPPPTAAEPMLFGGHGLTYYGRWTYKFEEAVRQGAAGVLLIHTDASATYPWSVVQSGWGGTQYSLPPPAGRSTLALKAWLTESTARAIVTSSGHNLDDLRRAAMSRDARPVPLDTAVSGSLVQRVQERRSPNVIGVLRGQDEREGVLVTAHYDHLPVREAVPGEPSTADRIFNGAIDNASGVAGTLAIARALAGSASTAAVLPRRSIYVMFTTAEESGLLGSEYFASQPVLPARAWAAAVNIDQLNVFGPSRDLVLIGAERSTIRDLASEIAARVQRVVTPEVDAAQGNFFRSDHFPLAKAGIPAVSLGFPVQFIGAGREAAQKRRDRFNSRDYHQTSDEIQDDWNFEGAVADLRLLADLVLALANAPVMPAYHADEPFARVRR
jgi:Zn-dependent M28 family amino/carboxypeptidase